MQTRHLNALQMIVAILLISTVPLYAQRQQQNVAKLKAEAQKVVSIISGDEAKKQTYCEARDIAKQIVQAGQQKDAWSYCSPLNARRDRARRRRHRCPRQTRAAGSGGRAFGSCRQVTLRSVKPFAQRLGITVGRQF